MGYVYVHEFMILKKDALVTLEDIRMNSWYLKQEVINHFGEWEFKDKGDVGGGIWMGKNVNPWLIDVNVWPKPLQYCKVISLQLIKKKK